MKVSPLIKHEHKTVDYTDLAEGDAFVYGGELYIKYNGDTDMQYGISLSEPGFSLKEMCSYPVIPVNAEIKWSYKEQPKKAKAKKK